MLRNVFLVTLVMCSVCAVHWEIREVESSEDVDVMPADKMTKQKLPGVCWACNWVMRKVKKMITPNSTKEEIEKDLHAVCEKIGFLKSLCKSFVKKYLGTLVEDLSTTDGPKTICVNVGVCKSKSSFSEKFIPSSDPEFDNFLMGSDY
ncbi:antimicrobial peptide NK-lysin-like [Triplophysa dalaica]|uniref:antimicrobial peptide NK-lysin-like n=1 Tax=Triplophysa dalaica TaxID=1582913 RepID=UPI0024DF8B48|nr:antimicrobial peptide NK-lysin-like [Triplophysa dalaica]XP_056623086.1 antimicrobial peptide NK-lysin-like [Triplophysa dalaica]